MSDVQEFINDVSSVITMLESCQVQERSIITAYSSVFSNEELIEFERSESSNQKSIDSLKSLRANFAEKMELITSKGERDE